MKTMKNYQDLHLKCDILPLAEMFENFRNNSLKKYGLCPSHHLRAPSLSCDTILKITKIKYELIVDPFLRKRFKTWNFLYFQ